MKKIKPFIGDQNDQELKTLFDHLLTLRNTEDIRTIDRNTNRNQRQLITNKT